MSNPTRQARIASLVMHHQEDRIARGVYHGKDSKGRAIACLLGALGNDIKCALDCPADVMPAWLAALTPDFSDRTSLLEWPGIIDRYVAAAQRWTLLTPKAWRRCELRTRRAALVQVLPHDTRNLVSLAIDLIDSELGGGTVLPIEWKELASYVRGVPDPREAKEDQSEEDAPANFAAHAVKKTTHREHDTATQMAQIAGFAAYSAARKAHPVLLNKMQAGQASEAWAWDAIANACIGAIEAEIAAADQWLAEAAAISNDAVSA